MLSIFLNTDTIFAPEYSVTARSIKPSPLKSAAATPTAVDAVKSTFELKLREPGELVFWKTETELEPGLVTIISYNPSPLISADCKSVGYVPVVRVTGEDDNELELITPNEEVFR